jgi:vesicle-associated membrane protein 7
MPIVYALVARGTTVLAEHTDSKGNVSIVANKVLEHIPHGESRMSYVYDRYVLMF